MKKLLAPLFVVALLSAFSYPKHKPETKCREQKAPFLVDGNTRDWKTGSLTYDGKTGFAYAFSNDNRNLYLQLKILDGNVQRKALITGLTVWIDPEGKGKQVLGIVYPQGRMHRPASGSTQHPAHRPYFRPSHHSGNQKLSPGQIRMLNERFVSEVPQFKGFEKNGLTGEKNIRALLQLDTLGHAVYEARIPLETIFTHPADYLTKAKPFSVILETGYLQMDMSRMQGQGMGGGNRGGGGRMGGGQRPDPSRMAFMQSMAEPSRLKIKTVKLFQIK